MNEGTKTGVFWLVSVVMMSIAAFVAWPKAVTQQDRFTPGLPLFDTFTDPLVASSMKIITFSEERGQLGSFEVRKDSESGLWTIPSRGGYPADALEQMRDAANAFVGLKTLDMQTSNAEDHDDLGVVEPKMEDLEVGDEGVGRLVTFKDDKQEILASLIIGDPLKDDRSKRYVRIPGQDPVYVVKLDISPLTTRFQDWIEEDLLQLSSIDIKVMEIKDYNASINLVPGQAGQGQIAVTRNYTASVAMENTEWRLLSLLEFDPNNALADPIAITPKPGQKLNRLKFAQMKDALDDLRIVNVVRKPEGMSTNLRANQDLLSDKGAITSLAQRGFYPVPSGPNGETEILSANGEMSVVLEGGVKYIMRFGNIEGVTNRDEAGQPSAVVNMEAGVNRFLLVTTAVDESSFPPPELRSVPQTLEELDDLLKEAGEETGEDEELTEEERFERLEAEQEKITKQNQRKLDERKDRMEEARKRVRDLNARFADWYYVIPEDTYSVLRIEQSDLFEVTAILPPNTQSR
ncbi:MAG: DUF4340 domain-containing protein [Planctomycetota bacterium]